MEKISKGLFWVIGMLFLQGCMKHHPADLIVHNGTIYTCDEQFTKHQAMAIRDGKVVELGPERQILNKYHADEILDLEKRVVVPTFFDGHSYLLAQLSKGHSIDYSNTPSIIEALEDQKISYVFNVPDQKFEELKQQLKGTNKRYLIRNRSGNILLVDASSALDIKGWSSNKPILVQNTDSISDLIDTYEVKRFEYLTEQVVSNEMLSNGYLGLSAFGLSGEMTDHLLTQSFDQIYLQLVLSGNEKNWNYLTKKGRVDSGNVHVKGLSYFIDGGMLDKQALLKKSYSNDTNYGSLKMNDTTLTQLCQLSSTLGFQLRMHAFGDSAFALAVQEMGKVLQTVNDQRWMIEHAQLASKQDYEALRQYSIQPSVQPVQYEKDQKELGALLGERSCSAYDFSGLLMQNQFLASGSFYPLGPLNAFEVFRVLVEEQENCNHSISRKEALKSMTIYPAMAGFFDEETGSLEPGKNGDFVVLNSNLMTIHPKLLNQIKVDYTFSKGRIAFRRN